jgi:DNA-binding IclR family transcriptional regulator
MSQPNDIRVVAKTLRLIEALAQANTSVRLGELARVVDQPKTSVFRILATLKQQGYVQQGPGSDAYALTDRISLLGRSKIEDTLRHAARPFLGRLLVRFEQTVNIAVFDAGQIRYVEILAGLRSIRASPTANTNAPLHCTGLGKSILAFLPPDEARRRLEANAPLQKYTEHTITSVRALTRELARIRKQGFAFDNEETEEGARCIAAPILGPKGDPLAAISVSGAVSSLRSGVVQEIAQALKQCSRGISIQLGYRP